MAITRKVIIQAPHDPEINAKVREVLEYYITYPEGYDQSKSYGLVFCITGYGSSADSEYQSNKLRPYISDKYNIITVGVRYHNDLRTKNQFTFDIDGIREWYSLETNYFKDIRNPNKIIDDLFELLISRNIYSLDTRLAIKMSTYHQYSSFGFMPAIDHLTVLFDIIKKHNIDKRNIVAFGTSYGGYIASLMAKYAPNTFSLVIDNSGFCVTQLQEVFGGLIGGAGGAIVKYVDNKRYEIPIATNTLWSLDETAENYFSDANKQIRNLLIEDHRTPSQTVYCCYHSEKDKIACMDLKDKMYNILKKYNFTYYKRINEKDVDGKLFKNSLHGMDASLRKMFDFSVERFKEFNDIKDDETDFDKNISYGFPCANKLYNFSYSNNGLKVEIKTI
ncbi:pimeloyl-ACP methyl ester carboxylesterase [Clostridium tetanomorphum]|uniref:DUF2920 family protein n=1 Tax=Clostridium tetanomorphum TaxID=1553 RepID=UPI00044F4C4E|nr:DUF2920 family protein [Clostridium tetanomorphum]KAJ52326.1 hypothetical protein CTM_08311 [Clostridium tetanomorphum DSM 665]MBP1865247.1 pimeloyl-ACP methyl ester carboxylesterase [Clostridium tetanomorphum]NRS85170.1 pimeloyl-ACP methyl ester carboxylesterase [Clostridium tetanomorphum]SQC03126.1 Protein of uncharacterised function (DUF2920) [Clostridium tetanomorphum]